MYFWAFLLVFFIREKYNLSYKDLSYNLLIKKELSTKKIIESSLHTSIGVHLYNKITINYISYIFHNAINFRYNDHSLTAVTSSMLNISPSTIISTELNNQLTSNSTSITNLNNNNNIQISNQHQLHQIHNANGTSYVYEYYKVPEKDAMQWR